MYTNANVSNQTVFDFPVRIANNAAFNCKRLFALLPDCSQSWNIITFLSYKWSNFSKVRKPAED